MMLNTLAFFAEAAPASPAPASGSGGLEWLFMMLPLFLVFYWFFMLRPQQKQEDKHRKMLESLDKNAKVMTVGGLIGSVHSVDREAGEIVLKVDDTNNTKIRFHLTAIHTVFKEEEKTDKK